MKVFKGGLFCLGGPIWVFQRLKWLLLRSRGGRHPNLIIVYASEAHTGNKYVWIRLQIGIKWLFLLGFEFSKDQKRSRKATNVFFNWQRSSKVPKHSSKIICCGVVSHLNVYIHLAYYTHLSTAVAQRKKKFKHFAFNKYFSLVLGVLKSKI